MITRVEGPTAPRTSDFADMGGAWSIPVCVTEVAREPHHKFSATDAHAAVMELAPRLKLVVTTAVLKLPQFGRHGAPHMFNYHGPAALDS